MPIRLLILITDLDVGGTPLDVLRLATSLPRDRFAPLVVSLADVGPVGNRLQAAGIPVAACNARTTYDVRALARLIGIVRTFRPDILHSFLFHANLAARLLGPVMGVARDQTLCTILTVETERLWHLHVEALTCRRCRYVVANSRSVFRHLHGAAGVPRSRLRLIPGGVDLDAVVGVPPLDRRRLGLPANAPIALWVGRLDPIKGLDDLITAAAILRPRAMVHFVLVGEGPYELALRRRMRETGTSDVVHLLGRRDDIPALLAMADLFVFPSRAEGLPNALLEAMASAKPIVTTDAPGCRDLICPERTGLIVPPRDPRELAHAIERLIHDPALSAKLGTAARHWVAHHGSWSRTRRAWLTIYEEITGAATAIARRNKPHLARNQSMPR